MDFTIDGVITGEVCSKKSFLSMKICSNLLVVRANNIWRLEFWFETLEISLTDGIAGKNSHTCS